MKFSTLATVLAIGMFTSQAAVSGGSHEHGHDHGDENSGDHQAHSDVSNKEAGSGESFEYVWLKNGSVAVVLLSDWETNAPLTDVLVEFIADKDPDHPVRFEMIEAGRYRANLDMKRPLGQLIVTYQGGALDVADVAFPEDHDHSPHDALAEHSHLLFYAGFALLFLIGLGIGIFIRRRSLVVGSVVLGVSRGKRNASGAAVVLLAALVFQPHRLLAHEGHTHAEAEIGGSGSKAGEVKISKESQFLIHLKTIVVEKGASKAVYKTVGHVSALPQFDAWLTAPRAGILSSIANVTIGTHVKKGQLLAKLDAIGTIEIRAPFSGIILGFNAVQGVRVGAGEKMFRIVNRDRMWVDAEVYQRDLGMIGAPETAFVSLDNKERSWSAKYVGTRTAVEQGSLNAHVYFELEQPDESLPIGATVSVEIKTASEVEGYPVPRGAVQKRGGETVVFVKTGVESFEERPVSVSRISGGETIVITKGLHDGERVVVRGAYQLLVGAN